MMKLVSLNMERSRHLERNIPFLQKEKPDIFCAQEVFEADREKISEELEMPFSLWLEHTFTDDETNTIPQRVGYSGIAIFSRVPFIETGETYYYVPTDGILPELHGEEKRKSNAQCLLWVKVAVGDEIYVIVNTHFTWTIEGVMDENQITDFEKLRKILVTLPKHILAGDLNAPRGNGMWEKFRELYDADNIPPEIVSTIDPDWHRVPALKFVVDALFTQKPYFAENVRIVGGLSDHKGIVATIGTEK